MPSTNPKPTAETAAIVTNKASAPSRTESRVAESPRNTRGALVTHANKTRARNRPAPPTWVVNEDSNWQREEHCVRSVQFSEVGIAELPGQCERNLSQLLEAASIKCQRIIEWRVIGLHVANECEIRSALAGTLEDSHVRVVGHTLVNLVTERGTLRAGISASEGSGDRSVAGRGLEQRLDFAGVAASLEIQGEAHFASLVKKLRRKEIQDYEAANAYLEAEYLPEHNRRFAREAARPEDYHVRTPSAARLREVFRLETERWISNDWVVQYRGDFLQLKPQNRRYGPTRSKALICEWEDGAVDVRYRDERIEYEDLVLRPSVVTAPKARPHREPAKHGRTKPALNHPWREGHAERRKQLLLDRTQVSALIGASASASP